MKTLDEQWLKEFSNRVVTDIFDKSWKLILNPIKDFLESNPEIDSVSWVQYTSNPRNGTLPEFRAEDFSFFLPQDSHLYLASDRYNSFYPLKSNLINNCEKINEEFLTLESGLETVDLFLYLYMFGEPIEVFVTKESVFMRDYDPLD